MLIVSAGAAVLGAARPARVGAALVVAPGCAAYSQDDSLDFLDQVHGTVTDTSTEAQTFSLLPRLPADSVQWGGTSAQCDTVAARFRAFRMASTGDTLWPLLPVALLRVGGTRWVGDPHVGNAFGLREWVILDSALIVLKIVKTVP